MSNSSKGSSIGPSGESEERVEQALPFLSYEEEEIVTRSLRDAGVDDPALVFEWNTDVLAAAVIAAGGAVPPPVWANVATPTTLAASILAEISARTVRSHQLPAAPGALTGTLGILDLTGARYGQVVVEMTLMSVDPWIAQVGGGNLAVVRGVFRTPGVGTPPRDIHFVHLRNL